MRLIYILAISVQLVHGDREVNHTLIRDIEYSQNIEIITMVSNNSLDSILASFSAYNESFKMLLKENLIISTINPKITALKYIKPFNARILRDDQYASLKEYREKSIFYTNSSEDIGSGRLTIRISKENVTATAENLDIHGIFSKSNETFNIMPSWRYSIHMDDKNGSMDNMDHVLYKHSDVSQHDHNFCEHSNYSENKKKRNSNFTCLSSPKTLNIGIAADCTYISFHRNVENSIFQFVHAVNMARFVII